MRRKDEGLHIFTWQSLSIDSGRHVTECRPGKVDFVFHIGHLLDLHASGCSLFQTLYLLGKLLSLQPLKVGVSWFGRQQ